MVSRDVVQQAVLNNYASPQIAAALPYAPFGATPQCTVTVVANGGGGGGSSAVVTAQARATISARRCMRIAGANKGARRIARAERAAQWRGGP